MTIMHAKKTFGRQNPTSSDIENELRPYSCPAFHTLRPELENHPKYVVRESQNNEQVKPTY